MQFMSLMLQICIIRIECDNMLDRYFMHSVVQAVSMGLQATAATSFVSSFAALYLSVGGMLL
jgi:hypothetical protein